MRRIALIGAALSLLALMDACTPSDKPIPAAGSAAPAALPPVAERRPHTVEAHGQRRVDDYYWLRDDDREDPAVLAYLEAENAYVDASLAPLADLRETLFRELKGRMRQDDESVPYRDGDWIYQSRYRRELEHPIYLRQRAIGGAAQEVMLDVNELAAGHQYYEIGHTDRTAPSFVTRRVGFTSSTRTGVRSMPAGGPGTHRSRVTRSARTAACSPTPMTR